jgi:site-specific recombinase XerD
MGGPVCLAARGDPQDILDAVDARHGPVIQHRIVALRSLFRALRQERVIFRDPTRGISPPAPARLPQPLPADRVAGLLNRVDGPAAQLAVALVAIHAVPEADLVRIQAADLNLASATLTIRRRLQHRVIYFDEVTAALASQWLRYRHQRWPGSRNPHLLVSQQTAADTSPVGPTMIRAMFEPLGVRPVRLRQDASWTRPAIPPTQSTWSASSASQKAPPSTTPRGSIHN